jgi:hypothetical protein
VLVPAVCVFSWSGQKRRRPKIASSDGVSVSPASNVTKIVIASAGPGGLDHPEPRHDHGARPTITVAAGGRDDGADPAHRDPDARRPCSLRASSSRNREIRKIV